MIALIENGKLATALDANNFNLENVSALEPVPPNLVETDDPRLADDRMPLAGSVTNDSIDPAAGIEQSKLDLNGDIPATWLGTTSTTAAQGDLAELKANKGQPDGYASLDGGGKIPAAQLPSGVGAGTVTSVALSMPADFTVSGSPITGSGTLTAAWAPIVSADPQWFGRKGGAGTPQFYSDELPIELIPQLDADQVASGEFDPDRLPEAVGFGVGHASGAVPDPGDGSGGALATDYLARDMTYKPLPDLSIPYQPTVDDPVLSPSANITGPQTVVFSCPTVGATIFYSLTSDSADFIEVPDVGYISLDPLATVWSYAAHSGYNNSDIVDYTNPNP